MHLYAFHQKLAERRRRIAELEDVLRDVVENSEKSYTLPGFRLVSEEKLRVARRVLRDSE